MAHASATLCSSWRGASTHTQPNAYSTYPAQLITAARAPATDRVRELCAHARMVPVPGSWRNPEETPRTTCSPRNGRLALAVQGQELAS